MKTILNKVKYLFNWDLAEKQCEEIYMTIFMVPSAESKRLRAIVSFSQMLINYV